MPSKAYPFGEWLPDEPGDGLTIAKNVRAVANGYEPIKAPQAVTVTFGNALVGCGAFIGTDGNSSLLAATAGGIFKYNGAGWDGVATFSAPGRRYFSQFGDTIIFASGDVTSWSYNLLTSAVVTPTDIPHLIDAVPARDFVMGITTDNALQWSQFNDCMTWTTGTNEADKQPSLWGELKRLVGGEYVIALTDRSIVRGTYVGVEGGLDIVWQFDQISQEVGCMAEGSVCNVGRLIFFLSERGFMMCDGNEVTPIADEKFNRWFFGQFSRDDIANIWAAVDPRNSTVKWAMPGTPGLIIEYNWVLKRATTIEIDITGMFTGFTSGTTIDALTGSIDAMTISLDDPSLQGGNPLLMIAGADNSLYALTGDNLEATLQLENVEPTPGRRSRIRETRLVTDATDASVTIDARMMAGHAESIRSASTMRQNGKLPIRANGRYNTVTATIPAGVDWSYIKGVELAFEAGDGR